MRFNNFDNTKNAIQKALENFKLDKNNLEDIISKLEESSDEKDLD